MSDQHPENPLSLPPASPSGGSDRIYGEVVWHLVKGGTMYAVTDPDKAAELRLKGFRDATPEEVRISFEQKARAREVLYNIEDALPNFRLQGEQPLQNLEPPLKSIPPPEKK